MIFEVMPSYKLKKKRKKALSDLLSASFPSYPKGKTYFRQAPCFHALISLDKKILAHAGVFYRVIFINEKPVKIFGISDLCVDENYRKNGLGKLLLEKVQDIAQDGDVEFLAVMTNENQFYVKQGFKRIDERARWILMGQNRMLGMQERQLKDVLYVKPLTEAQWPNGLIDFVGPLF